jgi:4-hydroxybenzoate polyprenyltransferase
MGNIESSSFFSPVSTFRGLVKEIRPHQWYKQLLLFAGILFSQNLLKPGLLGRVALGFVAFCAAAGAVYIFNDISDVEADRNHPSKRNRPIASGQVTVPTAIGFGLFLVGVATGVGYLLGTYFLAILVFYMVQNIVYSAYLKQIAFVDVIVIAVGFVLRAVAGVVVISASLSPWLIVSTFLLALLLALAKRYYELNGHSEATRSVLAAYSEDLLDRLLMVVATSLLVSFSVYSFFATTDLMLITLPMVYYGVFRFFYLLFDQKSEPHPLVLLRDRAFASALFIWIISVFFVLYVVPGVST